MKLVSVVIPSYNHAPYIRAAVESVLAQTHTNIELIVIDDGSTDGTRNYLRALADRRCKVIEQPNAGAHAAINRGLTLASGDVLAILNSDDVFHPGRIDGCLSRLEEDGCDLVASWLEIVDEAGTVLGVKEGWKNMLPWPIEQLDHPIDGLDEFANNLLMSNFVSTTSNMVFTRRLYERIGGMRNLRFAHDWDFLFRAAHAFRCALIEKPLLKYRIHATNTITSNRAWMLFEICWVFAVALRRLEGVALFRDGAREELARDVRFLGKSINVQGNDKVLWMIDRFINTRAAAGEARPEERLLDDEVLRQAFIEFVVT